MLSANQAHNTDHCIIMSYIWFWHWLLSATFDLDLKPRWKTTDSDFRTKCLAFDIGLWPTTLTHNPSLAKVRDCTLMNAPTDRWTLPNVLSLRYVVDKTNSQGSIYLAIGILYMLHIHKSSSSSIRPKDMVHVLRYCESFNIDKLFYYFRVYCCMEMQLAACAPHQTFSRSRFRFCHWQKMKSQISMRYGTSRALKWLEQF